MVSSVIRLRRVGVVCRIRRGVLITDVTLFIDAGLLLRGVVVTITVIVVVVIIIIVVVVVIGGSVARILAVFIAVKISR